MTKRQKDEQVISLSNQLRTVALERDGYQAGLRNVEKQVEQLRTAVTEARRLLAYGDDVGADKVLWEMLRQQEGQG